MGSQNPRYQASLFKQLGMPSQAQVMSDLRPHFPRLWDAVMCPWEDFLDRRGLDRRFTHMTEDEAGVWLTTQAAHDARGIFRDVAGFRVIDRHRKPVIVVEGQYAITIKKLTRRLDRKTGKWGLSRSNYLTTANQDYWEQRQNGDCDDLPRVILGYEFLKELTDIKLYIAYPRTRRKGVEWAIEMPPQTGLMPVLHVPRGPDDDTGRNDRGFNISGREGTGRNVDGQGAEAE